MLACQEESHPFSRRRPGGIVMQPKSLNPRIMACLAVMIMVGSVWIARLGGLGVTGADDVSAQGTPVKGTPVVMPANLTGFLVTLGLKDQKGTDWSGAVSLSAGKLLAIDIVQGGAKSKVDGNKFTVRSNLPA